MDRLVTIITPSYNHERFIRPCIESVLAQTYQNWRQIVVDDGSSDRTRDIVAGFRDPRISCIPLPHRGLTKLADTYNAALAASDGDLVAILEGDDAWPKHKLETQVAAFDDPGVFMSWGRATEIDDRGAPIRKLCAVATTKEWVDFDATWVFARLTRMNPMYPSVSVMVRRTALDVIGGFRQSGSSLYVDLPTWLWLTASMEGRVRFINRDVAHYRVHQSQTTRRFKRRMEVEHLSTVLEVVRQLPADTLERLRWAELERPAVVAGLVADGYGFLGDGDYAAARAPFLRAFREATDWRDRSKAALGVVSAALRVDLISTLYRLRMAKFAARPEAVRAD